MSLTTASTTVPAAATSPDGSHREHVRRAGRRTHVRVWGPAVVVALLGGALVAAIGSDADTTPVPYSAAERYEREAQLEGRARTYGGVDAEPDFVAGSRRMPLR